MLDADRSVAFVFGVSMVSQTLNNVVIHILGVLQFQID